MQTDGRSEKKVLTHQGPPRNGKNNLLEERQKREREGSRKARINEREKQVNVRRKTSSAKRRGRELEREEER